MIYCPKCGVQTEQRNEKGITLESCPSCGVGWLKFLEAMACGALLKGIVRRNGHDVFCPKCGYERTDSDTSTQRNICPMCSAIYAQQLLTDIPAEQREIIQSTSVEQQNTIQKTINKTYSVADGDKYLDALRRNSHYPALRFITMAGLFLGYLLTAILLLGSLVGVFKGMEWKFALGGIMLGLVIAVISKAVAEASLMLADAADAIVHSSGRQAK